MWTEFLNYCTQSNHVHTSQPCLDLVFSMCTSKTLKSISSCLLQYLSIDHLKYSTVHVAIDHSDSTATYKSTNQHWSSDLLEHRFCWKLREFQNFASLLPASVDDKSSSSYQIPPNKSLESFWLFFWVWAITLCVCGICAGWIFIFHILSAYWRTDDQTPDLCFLLFLMKKIH